VEKAFVGASEQHIARYIYVLVKKVIVVQSLLSCWAILCVASYDDLALASFK
jgi:hypothetical protein